MTVSLLGDKPPELILLLNAIVDAYLDEVLNNEQRGRLERLQKMKDISSKYEENLRTKRKTYKEFAELAGQIPGSQGLLIKNQFQQ